MHRKYFPIIGAVIGFFIGSIPSIFMFVNDLTNQLLSPVWKIFGLLSKLNLPIGLTEKVLLSICVVVIIMGLVKNNRKVSIASLVMFLFIGAYIYSAGLILNLIYTALMGYFLGLIFYQPVAGIAMFMILTVLSIKPTIYAMEKHQEFLKYIEKSEKVQSLTIKELSAYFGISENVIRTIVEKYNLNGWSDKIDSVDYRYRTDRVKDLLEKENIVFREDEAYRPSQRKILTLKQLVKEFKVDYDVLKNIVSKYGVTPEITGNREDLNWYDRSQIEKLLEKERLFKNGKDIKE